MRKRLAMAFAAVTITAASLLTASVPAFAVNYASVTASDSMATQTDITGDSQLGAPSYSTRPAYSAPNMHGGIFEYGTNTTNNMQMVIRSFSNGALDTTFNGTGSATVTLQIAAADRMSVEMTTYANGTKWMLMEKNGFANSGLNYIHYGTYAAGFTGTLTLPVGSTYYGTYCTARPSGANFTRLGGDVTLLKDSAFTTPTVVLGCVASDNNIAGAASQTYDYLANLTGGTTIGTSGTWNVFSGQLTPSVDATNKSFVRMGISVNTSASASTDIAVTSVYLRLSTATQPTWYESSDTNAWTDMVIMRSTIAGTTTTSGSVVYSPAMVGARNGTLAVAPRYSGGQLYAYQHTTDWTTQSGKIFKFGTTGTSGVTSTTATTGTGPKEHIGLASDQTPGGTLKVLIPGGGDKKYWEVNATTGAITVGGTFSGTMVSYESLYWAPASDTNGVSYYARTGASTLTRMSLTTTPPTPTAPSTPAAPTATAGAGQVSLSWTAPNANYSAITDYEIDYSSNSGTSWDIFVDGTSTATTATVTGLTNGTAYVFRIRAVNGVGTSTSSSASTSVTPVAAPGAPTSVTGTFGNTQVALTWSAPSADNGSAITDYTIQYSSNSGSTWSTFTHTASTATSATVTGLTNGTSYTFQVAAKNAIGTGSYSTVSSAVVPATLAATATAPTAQAGDTAASVSWSAPTANGCSITDYTIQYSSDNGSTWTAFAHTASTATSSTVTGLTNGTAYKFRIAAINCAGTATFSSASIAVTPSPVPSQTAGLSVATNGLSNQVVLTWSAASGNGASVTDYLIEYSTDGGITWSTYADGTSTSTTATLTGLTNGSNYSFRISAISSIGTGLPSTTSASVTAVALPGTIASAPAAVSTPGEIALSWSAPASDGGAAISDYIIQYSTNSGSTWQTYADGVSASTSATLTGLTASASYTFKISAVNSLGTGTASTVSIAAVAQAAAAPGAVGQPTAIAGTNPGEVVLTWTAPTANGSAITDYVIEYSPDGGVTWLTFSDGTSAATTATITGLTVGTSYVFRVTALNSVGSAAAGTVSPSQTPAAVVQVVTPPVVTPVTPVATEANARLIPAQVTFGAQRRFTAGSPIAIEGTNLDMVQVVLVGNHVAEIVVRTETKIQVKAPKNQAGLSDITLVYALGAITFHNAIDLVEPGPAKISLTRFWKHKISQRSAQVLLNKWAETSGATSVVCVAKYSATTSRALASWRAKRVCAYLKLARPSLTYNTAVSRAKSVATVEVRVTY